MSRQIWKYQLKITATQELEMPLGSIILSVKPQNRMLWMWAIVNTDPALEKTMRRINIFMTGQDLPDRMGDEFLGTHQIGLIVYHVFAESFTPKIFYSNE